MDKLEFLWKEDTLIHIRIHDRKSFDFRANSNYPQHPQLYVYYFYRLYSTAPFLSVSLTRRNVLTLHKNKKGTKKPFAMKKAKGIFSSQIKLSANYKRGLIQNVADAMPVCVRRRNAWPGFHARTTRWRSAIWRCLTERISKNPIGSLPLPTALAYTIRVCFTIKKGKETVKERKTKDEEKWPERRRISCGSVSKTKNRSFYVHGLWKIDIPALKPYADGQSLLIQKRSRKDLPYVNVRILRGYLCSNQSVQYVL